MDVDVISQITSLETSAEDENLANFLSAINSDKDFENVLFELTKESFKDSINDDFVDIDNSSDVDVDSSSDDTDFLG